MTSVVSHRRGERMRQTVLAAAFDELIEKGVTISSVAGVARRSGVHETTIYRRWATRENLFVDALVAHSADVIPTPDTGSTRGDLLALGHAAVDFVTSPIGSAVLQATVLPVDRRYAHARQAFWSARREALRPVIQRGIDRGELRADTDAQVLLETLAAPIYARLLITGESIDDEMPERIVDLVLDGAASRQQK